MSKQKSKKKTKPLNILLGVILLAGIAYAVYLVSESGNGFSETNENSEQYSSSYQFKKNGELTFTSKEGNFLAKIDIEIAETEEKQAQGLMYREKMEENQGMLFIFDRDDYRSFWMKNTVIPLDMIFANSDFEIVTIRKNTKPYDLSSYPSTRPAKYVVEVNAGFCNKYGIKVGDKISFRVF